MEGNFGPSSMKKLVDLFCNRRMHMSCQFMYRYIPEEGAGGEARKIEVKTHIMTAGSA